MLGEIRDGFIEACANLRTTRPGFARRFSIYLQKCSIMIIVYPVFSFSSPKVRIMRDPESREKQCRFLPVSEINNIQDLNKLFDTHDWELIRKDGYSELSVVSVLRCKRCKAERVCSLSSIARHKHLVQ